MGHSGFQGLTSARAWLDRLEQSPHALVLLFAASMMETLLVPIPIEAILVPWMLCRPERRWVVATVALAGNLTSAVIGYWLGFFAMEAWGDDLIGFFGSQEAYAEYEERFAEEGFVAILAVGILPLPFQIAMLAAGARGYSFPLFLLAILLARGLRYFGLATLVALAGEAGLRRWARDAKVVGIIGVVIFVGWLWFEFN